LPSQAVRAQLNLLSAAFRRTLPARLAELEAAWLRLNVESSAEAAAELRNVAHSLVGSAGTFGMPELGDAARPIDLALAPVVAAQQGAPADLIASLAPIVGALQTQLRHHSGQA